MRKKEVEDKGTENGHKNNKAEHLAWIIHLPSISCDPSMFPATLLLSLSRLTSESTSYIKKTTILP